MRSALVLGEAGAGKTTVALHRLKWLSRRASRTGHHLDAVVLVPTPELRQMARSRLNDLGLRHVPTFTVDAWIALQGRAVFPDAPERDSRDATLAVIRLKRHPAVRGVLGAVAETGRHPHARHYDLFHLWGDIGLLQRVVETSEGQLSEKMARKVRDHACVQFTGIAEDPEESEEPVLDPDGISVEEGTPTQDARSIDVEDFPVLFALDDQKCGRRDLVGKGLRGYDHIVIDEAQEIAPMELAVIGRALSPGGAITVAGDEHQQTDPTAYFGGWSGLARELRAEVESVTLEGSYRCPPGVTRFARGVLGAGADLPVESDDVVFSRFDSEDLLIAELCRELRGITDADPDASVAVICRGALDARRVFRRVRPEVPARLGLSRAAARSGIAVAHLAQIKGQEFDFVVLPDVSEVTYPDTPAARRALYVAATRAIHQLWILGVGSSRRMCFDL